MTEDDTFKALKKWTYEATLELHQNELVNDPDLLQRTGWSMLELIKESMLRQVRVHMHVHDMNEDD